MVEIAHRRRDFLMGEWKSSCDGWRRMTGVRTHKFRVQIAGDAVHSRRLLYDPVEEICQGRRAASRLAVVTDGGRASPGGKLQVHQCHNCKPN